MEALRLRRSLFDVPPKLVEVVAFALVIIAGLALATRVGGEGLLTLAVVGGAVVLLAWMTYSERYELTLAVFVAYIGLADGYLKLRFNNDLSVIGRDALLYAIVAGGLIRWATRHQQLRLPPLSGWVIAWIVVVLLQVANPENGTLTHSLLALRPHLEFVPLFFLGYSVMRTKGRLRGLIWLLVTIAAINGYVGFVQTNLSREELASWGPGYAEKIEGTDKVSGRGFVTDTGEVQVRPFALGSDQGFGGAIGVIAVPCAIALFALIRRKQAFWLALALGAGVIVAIITSQARVAVLSAIIAGAAYALLATTARQRWRTALGLMLAVGATVLLISAIAKGTYTGVFDRYDSLAPGRIVETAIGYRSTTIETIPTYAQQFPLGAGIGTVGPGGDPAGGNGKVLNGESQFTFLLIETGVPGLIVLLGLSLHVLWLLVRRAGSILDHDERLMVVALMTAFIPIFVSWYVGIATASTPGSAYFWFAAGLAAWWLAPESPRERTALPAVGDHLRVSA